MFALPFPHGKAALPNLIPVHAWQPTMSTLRPACPPHFCLFRGGMQGVVCFIGGGQGIHAFNLFCSLIRMSLSASVCLSACLSACLLPGACAFCTCTCLVCTCCSLLCAAGWLLLCLLFVDCIVRMGGVSVLLLLIDVDLYSRLRMLA